MSATDRDIALELLRLTRAAYDATVANMFINMEILALTRQILHTNLEHFANDNRTGDILAEILEAIKGKERS